MTDAPDFTFAKKDYEKLLVFKSFRIQRADMADFLVTEDYDITFDQVRYTVETLLVADNLAQDVYDVDVVFKAPSTTWQMFKQTHADSWWLGWLVRRRPVVKTETTKTAFIKVARYLGYPDARAKNPSSLGRSIIQELIVDSGVTDE